MKNKLKFNLFFVPSLVIVFSFILVLIGINVAFKQYISNEVDKHIESKFSSFNLYINDEKYWDKAFKGDAEDFLIPTEYIIFDEKDKIVDSSFLSNNDIGNNKVYKIKNFYLNNKSEFNNKEKVQIKLQSEIYYGMLKKYFGYYDGYILFEPNKTSDNKVYKILVFSDISPIAKFIKVINKILVILMGISIIISLIIILRSSRKLTYSFYELKEYIYRIGKREKFGQKKLIYDEFNDVVNSINKMAKMIDEAEENQKVFFQNASHDLRTPLMSIQGYAEAVKNGVKSSQECIDIILKESSKMSKLVDDILVLSKIDSIKLNINLQDSDINEIIYDCAWRLKPRMDEKNIFLKFDIESEHTIIRIDENLIERALVNILSNAIRYANNFIAIGLYIGYKDILISIKDDGGKIKPEEIKHIFERFYNGNEGNFGIGLALTREIIELHKGKIILNAKQDMTEFLINLPKNNSAILPQI